MRTMKPARVDTALPVVGQGTWMMGESPGRRDDEVRALNLGLDLGMTLIDTAEMYAAGESERVVGEVLKQRRDEVFLVSKVMPQNASRDGTMRACESSLKRLNTDAIDLYLLHWPSSEPLSDTIAAFRQLRDEGKIRHWGVSNFPVNNLQQAEQIAPGESATNQVLYNLQRRGIEHDMTGWCRDHGVFIMAYSPLDQGRLEISDALKSVAKRHDATPEQIALAWTIRMDHVITIPKASKPEHVEQNAQSAEIKLSDEDLKLLDEAFPPPNGPSELEWL